MKSNQPWGTLWSKAGAVTVRTKIMGIVAASILLTVLILVMHSHRDGLIVLRSQLSQRGIDIGASLATQSRDPILTNDQFILYRLLKDTSDATRDVVYIFALDPAGNVLAHTFDGGFPTSLMGKNDVPPGKQYGLQVFETGPETIQDIAIPVMGGKAGTIHVGMSEASINAAVDQHVRELLVLAALMLVLGLFVAYGLSSILTRPVNQLAEAARAIGQGAFRWRAPLWARDEIGSLGAAFNDMTEELRRKEELRQQLLAKVITAQEEERKRIARELHDETSQCLTSLAVGLRHVEDGCNSQQISSRIAELRALAAQTLDDVHRLATELRPSLLDDLGLVAALQQYTRDYARKLGVEADFQAIGMEGKRLPPPVEIALYRIVQEALTNVVRHAEAKKVGVLLEARNSSIVAIVEDDGKGFAVREMSGRGDGRLGLYGMQERASLIGGALTIESTPGTGTTIFVEVPFKHGQAE